MTIELLVVGPNNFFNKDLALKDLEKAASHLNFTCVLLTKALFNQQNRLNHLAAFDEMNVMTPKHNTQMNRRGEGMTHLLQGKLSHHSW